MRKKIVKLLSVSGIALATSCVFGKWDAAQFDQDIHGIAKQLHALEVNPYTLKPERKSQLMGLIRTLEYKLKNVNNLPFLETSADLKRMEKTLVKMLNRAYSLLPKLDASSESFGMSEIIQGVKARRAAIADEKDDMDDGNNPWNVQYNPDDLKPWTPPKASSKERGYHNILEELSRNAEAHYALHSDEDGDDNMDDVDNEPW